MDKTNISKVSSEKEKDFESSANNVYNYKKKFCTGCEKKQFYFLNKICNNLRQRNRSEAMCYDTLRMLNKDSNSEKQTINIKKSDNSLFLHANIYDEGTMAVVSRQVVL